VQAEHVEIYLAGRGRFQLEGARQCFRWIQSRKKTPHRLAELLPVRRSMVHLRVLSVERLLECYRRWTADDGTPCESLVGLLALVHCLRSGEIRHLRLDDIVTPDRIRVGRRVLHLAPPVAASLGRYLSWRERTYQGPSSYLLVSRQSRLHDLPVSVNWFQLSLLDGIPIHSLRQSAIQQLVQALGCDGLQVAASRGLSLGAVGVYISLFGHRPGHDSNLTAELP